jgi:hypothetical protein
LEGFAFAATNGPFVAAEDFGEIGEAAATGFGGLDGGMMTPLAFGEGRKRLRMASPTSGGYLASIAAPRQTHLHAFVVSYSDGAPTCQKD